MSRRISNRRDALPVDDERRRRRLAAHLGRSAFPGDRTDLLRFAVRLNAPDEVILDLRHLPGGQFRDVDEVARALRAQTSSDAVTVSPSGPAKVTSTENGDASGTHTALADSTLPAAGRDRSRSPGRADQGLPGNAR